MNRVQGFSRMVDSHVDPCVLFQIICKSQTGESWGEKAVCRKPQIMHIHTFSLRRRYILNLKVHFNPR